MCSTADTTHLTLVQSTHCTTPDDHLPADIPLPSSSHRLLYAPCCTLMPQLPAVRGTLFHILISTAVLCLPPLLGGRAFGPRLVTLSTSCSAPAVRPVRGICSLQPNSSACTLPAHLCLSCQGPSDLHSCAVCASPAGLLSCPPS